MLLPVVRPSLIFPGNPGSEHGVCMLQFPPEPRNFEPCLNEMPSMETVNFERQEKDGKLGKTGYNILAPSRLQRGGMGSTFAIQIGKGVMNFLALFVLSVGHSKA